VTFDPAASDRRPGDTRSDSADTEPMQGRHQPASAPIRVVIGSNDAAMRQLLGRVFAQDGRFEVTAQSDNGFEVVADPTGFDVAVLDLSIAGLGILGVISHLRRSSQTWPVVVVTQHDAIYLRHALQAEGATDYLVIPDDLPQVADRTVQAHRAAKALTIAG
jgi:DNA-binding NarL/FixJ family response regulator